MAKISSNAAAELLGFTSAYIRKLIRAGIIRAEKIENRWVMNLGSISKVRRKRQKRSSSNDGRE